jgi:hypothetical protein
MSHLKLDLTLVNEARPLARHIGATHRRPGD